MNSIKENRIHQAFEISVILKGMHACLELVGGALLVFVSNNTIVNIVASMTQEELTEDPNDLVAHYLFQSAQHLSVGGRVFAAWYLLSHGAIKLLLVGGLLKKKLWAYPASLVVLGLFILYQIYRFTLTPSVWLVLLSIFDLMVIWLVWHEYRLMRTVLLKHPDTTRRLFMAMDGSTDVRRRKDGNARETGAQRAHESSDPDRGESAVTLGVSIRSGQVRKQLNIGAPILLGGLLASGGVLYAMAEFHEEISETWLRNIDQNIMGLMHGQVSPILTVIMFALTFIGSIQAIVPAVALIALWLWHKDRIGEALLTIFAVAGSAVMNAALKLYFHRQRPNVPWALAHESSFSFPSGHSVAAICLYGILGYVLIDRVKSLRARAAILGTAVLLVLAIGVSRIYLGVHFPSDVAAGYLVGLIWLLTIIGSDLTYRRHRAH